MRRMARQAGLHLSVRELLDILAGIEESVLIYPSTGGRPKARREVHPEGMTAGWLDRWEEILRAGPDAVFEALTSRAEWAVELRQNSPFAGVLSPEERQAALDSFRAHWRSVHAA